MSEYTFGGMSYSGGNPDDEQDPGFGAGQQQSPKWFREAMEKMAEQNRNLSGQVESLLQEKRQTEIAAAFEAKGFARSAAALYTGKPEELDNWLQAHGDSLARTGQQPAPPQQPQGAPQGDQQAPQAGLPAGVQQDLQKMQQMGSGASPQGQASGDDELAAALRATTNPQDFLQVAQAHGWQYTADNMGFM